MGNCRFRISNMMPNAWFYKLRDMSKSSSRNQCIKRSHHSVRTSTSTAPKPFLSSRQQAYVPSRASYYISSRAGEAEKLTNSPVHHPKASDTHFPLDPPRPSNRKAHRKPGKPKVIPSSVSASCDCRVSHSERPAAGSDITIELPPILTKPSEEAEQLQSRKSPPRTIQRLRLRGNSPRLASRKPKNKATQLQQGRKTVWTQSFAVVKASSDPQRDFRESMVEMIVENNIRAAKDLEELLACYLSLNSDEYHDVIVKVFERIWFDFVDVRL